MSDLAPTLRWEPPVFPAPGRCPEDVVLHTAQQLDEMEAAAYQDGFARGHGEGYAAGVQQARAEAARLRELVAHLARPLAQIDEEVERTLVAMTVEVARRLVQQELELDPARVLGVVREAIGALDGAGRELRVMAHPEDAKLLQEHLVAPPEVNSLRVIADPSLMRGDCRVASEFAQVDARLDTRQANLAQSLIGEAE
ncbi:FliH/SctL family protein [Solimonas fluminis]|uniref:FliH/SctL family protein n=1 Tax=Solimonas fluminis TaxID=2086571 RepID=UPI0013FD79E0|nr:FliH/SctL family protein [Solimonas fluminis]